MLQSVVLLTEANTLGIDGQIYKELAVHNILKNFQMQSGKKKTLLEKKKKC